MQEFKPESPSSVAYVKRVQLFLTANNIPDDGKKMAVFFSVVRGSTHGLLRN